MLEIRLEDKRWLDKALSLSGLVCISGMSRAGKSDFVQDYLASISCKFKWISFKKLNSLKDTFSSDSNEIAQYFSFNEHDYVVLDGFSNLSRNERSEIIDFLTSTRQNHKTIIISNEDIQKDLGPLVPYRLFENLSFEQTKQFVEKFFKEDKIDIEKLYRETSGFPQLVKLYCLQGNIEICSSYFVNKEDLDESCVDILKVLDLAGDSLQKDQIARVLDLKNETVLKNLERLISLYYVIDHDDEFEINSSLKLPESFSENNEEIINKLITEKQSNLRNLRLALKTKDQRLVKESLRKIDIVELENYNIDHLVSLIDKLKSYLVYKDEIIQYQSIRIIARIYFLEGKRDKAKNFINSFIESGINVGISLFGQNLIVDALQLNNCAGDFKTTKNLYQTYKGLESPLYNQGLRLEYFTAEIENDLDQARTGLEDTLKELENFEPSKDSIVFISHCHFQLARVYDAINSHDEAITHYRKAYKGLSSLKMIYFATVAQHNIVWVLFNAKRWNEFEAEYDSCYQFAHKYGHQYIIAGLEQMMAAKELQNYNYEKALRQINNSLLNLKDTKVTTMTINSYLHKVEILQYMGFRKQASQCLAKVKSLGEDSLTSLNKKSIDLMSDSLNYLNSINLDIDDGRFRELFDREMFRAVLVRRDTSLRDSDTIDQQLAVYEAAICNGIKNNNLDELWQHIHSIELLLSDKDGLFIELVAIKILQKLLQKDHQIDDILFDLQRASWDEEVKAPLIAICETITNPSSSLELNSKWRKSSQYDRERWSQWFRKFIEESFAFTIIDHEGAKKSNEYEYINKGIVYDESVSKILLNGREIKDLSKRNQLKKILKILMEFHHIEISKEFITHHLWDEKYNPIIHDPRIYTAIQRLRKILNSDDCIINLDNGYALNQRFKFQLIMRAASFRRKTNKIQAEIVNAFETYHRQNKHWISRQEISDVIETSDATIKRELKKLIQSNIVSRKGAGKATAYSMIS